MQMYTHKMRQGSAFVDKLALPVVRDEDNLSASENEDLSELIGDISLIDRSQSEVVGFQPSCVTYIDFEVQNEVIPEEEYEGEVRESVDMRVPCNYCGRKFDPQVSLKHIPICKTNFEKKYGPLPRKI